MRYVWNGLLVIAVIAAVWGVWWYGWGRLKPGPPAVVVQEFLQAVLDRDWGTAQAYMTQHMRGRIGREGLGAMERFVEARLDSFSSYQVVRVTPRDDEVDVVARLTQPVPAGQPGASSSPTPGLHGTPGRLEGDRFVHAHRFQLQREGRGAWRIYQFEEVDERP